MVKYENYTLMYFISFHLRESKRRSILPPVGRTCAHEDTIACVVNLVRAWMAQLFLDGNTTGIRCYHRLQIINRFHWAGAAILVHPRSPGCCLERRKKGARCQRHRLPSWRSEETQRRTGTEPRCPWKIGISSRWSARYRARRGEF